MAIVLVRKFHIGYAGATLPVLAIRERQPNMSIQKKKTELALLMCLDEKEKAEIKKMINIDVVSENNLWSKKIKKPDIFFNFLVQFFPKKYSFIKNKVSLTILLSNNKNIKKLNKKFRKKNKPTDVLSFPFQKKLNSNKEIYLGDIIISYEFMNITKFLTNLEFQEKVSKIFIHGFLHLLGYDHVKLKDFKKMNIEELKIYNFISKKIEKFN